MIINCVIRTCSDMFKIIATSDIYVLILPLPHRICLTLKLNIIALMAHLDCPVIVIKEMNVMTGMITWTEIITNHMIKTCPDMFKIKATQGPYYQCPQYLCLNQFQLEETIAHRLQCITVLSKAI